MESQSSLIDRMVRDFSTLHRRIVQINHADSIRHGEFGVLVCLSLHERKGTKAMRPSAISEYMQLKQPTITPILQSLEEKGLIERHVCEEDRRAIEISLTETGRIRMNERREKITQLFIEIQEELGEEDFEQLAQLMDRVYEFNKRQGGKNPSV